MPPAPTPPAARPAPAQSGSLNGTFVVLGVLLAALAVYAVVLFVCYDKQTFIFKKYEPKPAPSNAFFPQGKLTPLTQEEIDARNAQLSAALDGAAATTDPAAATTDPATAATA